MITSDEVRWIGNWRPTMTPRTWIRASAATFADHYRIYVYRNDGVMWHIMDSQFVTR